jgi:hypothetical protein
VAGTLLGIDDHRRETRVQPAPPLACCASVDDRREHRVREPDPVALGDQRARVLCLDDGGERGDARVERVAAGSVREPDEQRPNASLAILLTICGGRTRAKGDDG